VAKTLSAVATEVQVRLGDTAAAVWTAAEIKRYLKEAYAIIAARTECFWKEEALNDAASTANITQPWEEQYLPTGSTLLGVFTYTADWELDYIEGSVYGPTNHTATWEITNSYVPFIGKGAYDLPDALIQIERATWDNRRIDPLFSSELENLDAQYHTRTGSPQGYIMDKDGLRILRKVPVPSASASGSDNNFKIEYTRKGTAVSADGDSFELPNRYTKYLRHYACYRCLEREGLGQDMGLAEFYRGRYEAGVGRMFRRKQLFNQRRNVVMGGSSERLSRPPLARMPFHYGRVVQ